MRFRVVAIPFLVLFFACPAVLVRPVAAATETVLAPYGDVRVRQESLAGVYHFVRDPDRNWIRFRTRAGVAAQSGAFGLDLRLANEHRRILHPEGVDLDWDEVIIDRLNVAWTIDPATRLVVGRQDIIWPGGFLMLEGHPLDGSRSIYHNAARLRLARGGCDLDLALIVNRKYDDLILSRDEHRALSPADEMGLAGRWTQGPWTAAVIFKDENDPDGVAPDLATWTVAGRCDFRPEVGWQQQADLALQIQDQEVFSTSTHEGTGVAAAGQFTFARTRETGLRTEFGGFYYSGLNGALRPFRAPWGNWPKWSELYIYTLIGESTPGRVHVAAWENIAAPRLAVSRPLGRFAGAETSARLAAQYLLAPEPDWNARGLLTQAELKFSTGGALTGHLLWEMLDPGAFHDGRGGLDPLTDTVHFLRWQITCKFE